MLQKHGLIEFETGPVGRSACAALRKSRLTVGTLPAAIFHWRYFPRPAPKCLYHLPLTAFGSQRWPALVSNECDTPLNNPDPDATAVLTRHRCCRWPLANVGLPSGNASSRCGTAIKGSFFDKGLWVFRGRVGRPQLTVLFDLFRIVRGDKTRSGDRELRRFGWLYMPESFLRVLHSFVALDQQRFGLPNLLLA